MYTPAEGSADLLAASQAEQHGLCAQTLMSQSLMPAHACFH